MLFNGIDLTGDFRIKDIRGRGLTGYEVELIDISGGPGSYFAGKKIPARKLEIDVEVRASNREEIRKKIEKINSILSVDKPVPIIFPDETDRIYYGIPQVTGEEGEYYFKHKGTLVIVCPDPFKYGKEIDPIPFVDDALKVTNKGTGPAKPIIEIDVKEPITFAMVQNQNGEYMMIGRPIEDGEIPTEPYERIADLSLGTLVGWSDLTDGQVLSGGLVGGKMKTTGNSFEVESYGTNPNGWVGPAVKTSFSQPIQNFAIDIEVTSRNTLGQTGKLMAILLDSADREIATMTLIDGTLGMPKNSAVFTIGNKTIMNESGENHGAYNNTTMHLNLSRNGRSIVAYAYKEAGGVRTGRIRRTYRDDLLEYQAPVASIILYIAKYKNYNPYPMSFNHLIADKSYLPSELEIPYIANPGDKIVFDFDNKNLLINGEPRKDLKDFGSSYFPLYPKENQLVLLPSNSLDATIKYREPYK